MNFSGHGTVPSLRLKNGEETPIDIDTIYGVKMYLFFNGQVDEELGPGFQIRPGTGINSLSFGEDYRNTVAGKLYQSVL